MSASEQVEAKDARKHAVIIVDPLSTGANASHLLLERGVPLIRVWSNKVNPTTMKLLAPGLRNDFTETMMYDYIMPARTVMALRALPYRLVAVVAGSELGVELADDLAEQLGLPGNGTKLTEARRDKYLMGETVRAAGIRAVAQAKVETWDDALKFLDSQPAGLKFVVKPARSSGSDDVFLCSTKEDIRQRMSEILGKKNKLGITNTCVLLQEYLEGDEYVVDTVSVDGVHKLAGCWKYIKGSANGADFVYHGMIIVDGESDVAKEVFEYNKKVLDALSIRNGCGHAEVMHHPTRGPCLVEVGARPHGGEGIFMDVAGKLIGYTQVDLMIAAAIDHKKFHEYPERCAIKTGFGAVVDMISFQQGRLKAYNEEAKSKLASAPSFLTFNCLPVIGDEISKTVDCFTTVGSVSLVGKDKAEVDADIALIRVLERKLFIVEDSSSNSSSSSTDGTSTSTSTSTSSTSSPEEENVAA